MNEAVSWVWEGYAAGLPAPVEQVIRLFEFPYSVGNTVGNYLMGNYVVMGFGDLVLWAISGIQVSISNIIFIMKNPFSCLSL